MSEALPLASDADKSDFVERAVLRAVQDLQAAQKLQGESVKNELAKLHSKIARGDAASALGQMEARLQKCEKEQERLASSAIAADNRFLTISALKAIEERLEKLEKFQEHLAQDTVEQLRFEFRPSHIQQQLGQLQAEVAELRGWKQEILPNHSKEVQRQQLPQLESQEARLCKVEKQIEDISKALEIQQNFEPGKMRLEEAVSGSRKISAASDEPHLQEGSQKVEEVEEPVRLVRANSAATVLSRLSSAESRAKGTRSYVVESNVYGLLVMPGRPLGSGAWLLLLLHYVLVFWLSYAIDRATARAIDDLMGEIDGKLCTKVSDSWDCAEPLLKQMTDFKSLDRDNDGKWSLEEARVDGLLAQFRAVHEIAVESFDILKVMVPAVSEVPDVFCSLALVSITRYGHAIGWEEIVRLMLKYMEEQGFDLGATYETNLPHMGLCIREFNYSVGYFVVDYEGTPVHVHDVYCLAQRMCETDLKGIPAQSSGDVYRKHTGYYSFFPEWIYEFLVKNLLHPCFLFDGDMCANAEIDSDFLRMVPRWQELGSADRVEQCKSYVDNFCPRILGDQFRAFSKDVSESCGQRKYETETIASDVAASRASLRNEFNHDVLCKDNDSSILDTYQLVMESNSFMREYMELMNSKGLLASTCEQIIHTGWCDVAMPVTRALPDGSTENIWLAKLIAESCPQACCKDKFYSDEDEEIMAFTPNGCNPLCLAGEHNDHASALQHKCFGPGCIRAAFRVEQFGQLRITRWAGWYNVEENSAITIYSNRSVRVNVIQVFAGGGLDCPSDSLQIDGTKVCKENLQQNLQLHVPMKSRDRFEILFHVSATSGCPSGGRHTSDECRWELVIVDAGERNEATISKLSFKQQMRFGIGPQGVRSFNYISFFFLILLVWVSFMWQELLRIAHAALFLCECPDLGSRRNRMRFLLSVCLPRLVIWGWVLHVGLTLLLASSEFVEIVLNSVALGFLLDVDEILFVVMVPTYVQEAILSMDPIRWKQTLLSNKRLCSSRILSDARVFLAAFALLLLIAGIVMYEYYKSGGYLETARQVDCLCDLRGTYCSSGVLN